MTTSQYKDLYTKYNIAQLDFSILLKSFPTELEHIKDSITNSILPQICDTNTIEQIFELKDILDNSFLEIQEYIDDRDKGGFLDKTLKELQTACNLIKEWSIKLGDFIGSLNT